MWECLWSCITSGPADQGKQCSESHLPAWQRRRYIEGTGGEDSALNKHMEKQIFPLPAAVSEGKCQHATQATLDCPELGTTTWLSLLSHRIWAGVTLWSMSPGQPKRSAIHSPPSSLQNAQAKVNWMCFPDNCIKRRSSLRALRQNKSCETLSLLALTKKGI